MGRARISAVVIFLSTTLLLAGCSTTVFTGKLSRKQSEGISPDRLASIAGMFEKQGKTDQAVHLYSHVLNYFPEHDMSSDRLYALQNGERPLDHSDVIIANKSTGNLKRISQFRSKPLPSVRKSPKMEPWEINPNIVMMELKSNKPVTNIIIPAVKEPMQHPEIITIPETPILKNKISISKKSIKPTDNEIGFFLKTKSSPQENQVAQKINNLKLVGKSYYKDTNVKQTSATLTQNESGKTFLNDLYIPVKPKVNTENKKTSSYQNNEEAKPSATLQNEKVIVIQESTATETRLQENQALISSVKKTVNIQDKTEPFKKAYLLLTDENPENRINGIMLLTKDSSRTTHKSELLEKQLSVETNLLVRVHIAAEILKLIPESETALPALYDGLASTDRQIRLKSISAIGESQLINTKESIHLLLQALEDKNSRVRATAALSLSNVNIELNLVTQGLTKALKDENIDVRIAADAAMACINNSQ